MSATVVLVHGAWHGGWCWAELQAALAAQGVASIAPDLPGHGEDRSPQADLAGDGESVSKVIAGIDGPVVLVGHSYGGNVISQAMTDPATAAKVTHLIYVCAIARPQGQSFGMLPKEVHEGSLLGPLVRRGEDGLTTLDTSDVAAAKAAFYADCSDEQVAAAVTRLSPQRQANLGATTVITAPLLVPSTYVVCTQDRAIPIAAQRTMIDDLRSAGASIDVVDLESSHSPFLSMPEAVASILIGRS
jgi:pimeloyl-ACP methyl ester carboxylesterase